MLTRHMNERSNITQYRGIQSDVVAGGNCYKLDASNGDEIYTMDTQKVYMYDEENRKWRDQEDGSEV